MKLGIYPGSFDPLTNGHLDVIRRADKLFDRVIVAIANNESKKPMFTKEERVELASESLSDMEGVSVETFDGLLVDYAVGKGAQAIIRGLRAISDFEFEFQLALMNRHLDSSIETIFMMPKDKYTFLSSRMVKEVASLGGDIKEFVPAPVLRAMLERAEEIKRHSLQPE
ncbi:MAG: pantetheine-phosphate adenylyltransferase [Verrucomicrobia bacterium]|jgi:pantetheine-phosphate adenylyltransferase|nr:pantetheine-phosphate adenylyltransferase [Verrucomicrobiota bacterium]